jgi:hypothetical protein
MLGGQQQVALHIISEGSEHHLITQVARRQDFDTRHGLANPGSLVS